MFALHDAADIFLNAAKLSHYIKQKRLCDFLFIAFTLCWVLTRLVLFPRVIVSCLAELPGRLDRGWALHGDISSITFLCFLQVIHLYWTVLIARMVWRSLFGEGNKEDIRSDGEEEEEEKDIAFTDETVSKPVFVPGEGTSNNHVKAN